MARGPRPRLPETQRATPLRPSQILRGAIDYIRQHGWRRDGYFGDGGQCCALNAMMLYTSSQLVRDPNTNKWDWDFDAQDEANRQLLADLKRKNPRRQSIAAWNDAQTDRTVVLRQMGATARRLEKEGR